MSVGDVDPPPPPRPHLMNCAQSAADNRVIAHFELQIISYVVASRNVAGRPRFLRLPKFTLISNDDYNDIIILKTVFMVLL